MNKTPKNNATSKMSENISRLIFPYDKDEVFEAIFKAIYDNPSIILNSKDLLSGIININVGVSIFSWGENVLIKVYERNDGNVEVKIVSDQNYRDKYIKKINELMQDIIFFLRGYMEY